MGIPTPVTADSGFPLLYQQTRGPHSCVSLSLVLHMHPVCSEHRTLSAVLVGTRGAPCAPPRTPRSGLRPAAPQLRHLQLSDEQHGRARAHPLKTQVKLQDPEPEEGRSVCASLSLLLFFQTLLVILHFLESELRTLRIRVPAARELRVRSRQTAPVPRACVRTFPQRCSVAGWRKSRDVGGWREAWVTVALARPPAPRDPRPLGQPCSP